MTSRLLILAAGAGSALLLAGAFFFQALGWAPCAMCLWQRWPHAIAGVLGIFGASLAAPFHKALSALGGLTTFVGAGIAAFHTGVERKWWEGPASCTGSGDALSGLSGDQLIPGAGPAPDLVLCDTLTPFFLGLTMANWNLIGSIVLAGIWITAFRRASA